MAKLAFVQRTPGTYSNILTKRFGPVGLTRRQTVSALTGMIQTWLVKVGEGARHLPSSAGSSKPRRDKRSPMPPVRAKHNGEPPVPRQLAIPHLRCLISPRQQGLLGRIMFKQPEW